MDKQKAIKRINERMAVYQRQGLTESSKYKAMKEKIELLGIPSSESRGRFKISMKKSDLAKINVEDLETLDAMPSLKQERQIAKEHGYKTTKEQNEYIINRGSFETWMEENMSYVYIDAKSGVESAKNIENLFKEKGKGKGVRNVDYTKVHALIDKYNEYKRKEKELLHDSNFSIDNKFNNDDKF